MSLNSTFAPAYRSVNVSASLQRRLRLLQAVSDSQLFQNNTVERIVNAIKHFSFDDGDPDQGRYHRGTEEPRAAVAAAGNNGGNDGVSWPAGLVDVIPIFSTDGYGNASTFSPEDRTRRCIATLGEGVPSCDWDAKSNELIYRNGTSFATPIAVAIAAIILGFINDTSDLDGPEDIEQLKKKLRTRSGMEDLMCYMHTLQTKSNVGDFYYITPWRFLEIEESTRTLHTDTKQAMRALRPETRPPQTGNGYRPTPW
ncbi:hypothetical protein F4810DRAFT_715850 [Camillea tinctor]|nr:hypothetical protein F4810DRAFT_715850 [Camillea tinctor]